MHSKISVHVTSEVIIIGRAHIVQFMEPIYLLLPQPRLFFNSVTNLSLSQQNLRKCILAAKLIYFLFQTSKIEGLILFFWITYTCATQRKSENEGLIT